MILTGPNYKQITRKDHNIFHVQIIYSFKIRINYPRARLVQPSQQLLV
jgi:hypothetical protein